MTTTSLRLAPPVALASWLGLASLLAVSGAVTVDRPLPIPLALVGGVTLLVALDRLHPGVRAWARALPLRAILALHAIRATVGVAFFVVEARGELTPAFAQPAGWGDLLVGVGALALLAIGDQRLAKHRGWVLAWNALGLADILYVVVTAQRQLLFVDPEGMRGLAGFPGMLLPTFLVPLVIATHALVFARRGA
jgi:hypothetical protein